MSNAKRTPGPWHVGKAGMDRLIYADSEHAFDLAIVRDGGDNTVEGNAALIAAAPDMLAALKAVVTVLDTRPKSSALFTLMDECRAAIAKAQG